MTTSDALTAQYEQWINALDAMTTTGVVVLADPDDRALMRRWLNECCVATTAAVMAQGEKS